jgi:hypothetical protein
MNHSSKALTRNGSNVDNNLNEIYKMKKTKHLLGNTMSDGNEENICKVFATQKYSESHKILSHKTTQILLLISHKLQ